MVLEMINTYGAQVLGALLIALFGLFGMMARTLAARYLDTPAKQKLAKLVVCFVEQTCQALHGEEKLNAALSVLAQLLAEEKITATETEMKVLLEAAVAEFNDVFHKGMQDAPVG